MKKPFISALGILLGFATPGIVAQNTSVLGNTNTTPVPGSGHDYLFGLSDIINPANGAVSVRIKAPAPTERGQNWPNYLFIYDSDGVFSLSPAWQDAPSTSTALLTGVTYASSPSPQPRINAGSVEHLNGQDQQGNIYQCTYYSNYVFTDANGGSHALDLHWATDSSPANGCGFFSVGTTLAGGDEYYKATLDPNTGAVHVVDSHGNGLSGVDSTGQYIAEDTNGNLSNSTGRTWSISGGTVHGVNQIDPATRVIPGSSSAYTYQYQEQQVSFTLNAMPAPSSQANDCRSLSITPFGSESVDNPSTSTVALIQTKTITLPDGKSYTFAYDPTYGTLSKITYPTGATVTYTWQSIPNTEGKWYILPQANGQAGGGCYLRHDWFAITKRVVSFDGQTNALEQDFQYNTVWGGDPTPYKWASKTTMVTTKDLVAGTSAVTMYTYQPAEAPPDTSVRVVYDSPVPQEISIAYYDTDGTLLKTTQKTWQTLNLLSGECDTIPGAGTFGRFYQYQPYTWPQNLNPANPDARLTELVTDFAEYDYGQIAGGCTQPSSTPTRETVTTYNAPLAQSTPNFPSAPSILDRPQNVVVYGIVSGNKTALSETDYLYDKTAVAMVNPISLGHDPAYSATATPQVPRGNATTVTRKCLSGCSADVSKTYLYDETGQQISQRDPNGNLTQYSYADKYSSDDGSASGNTNAYLTTVTAPNVNGKAYTRLYSYGFMDGQLRTSTDENGQQTTYAYNDPLARLTDVYGPPSAQNKGQQSHANTAYVDGPGATVTTTDPDGLVSLATLDGFGRTVKTQLTSDPDSEDGTDTVDTVYNGLGLVASVSNPYRASDPAAGQPGSTRGTTQYSYDALGRAKLQTNQDNSTQQYTWSGNTVKFQSELGFFWQRTYDAFGDLTTVTEPDASNNPAYETDYQYDALGNLKQADQWGGKKGSAGDRVRSFVYDGLSRLTSSTSPESGTVGYSYDGNGNVLTNMDARGVVTTYTWDALNRPIGKTYTNDPSGTPAVSFSYDVPKQGWALPSQTYPAATPSAALNAITQSNLAGRLSWATNGSATMVYGYDEAGRTVLKSECTPSTCASGDHYDMHAIYDLAGHPSFTDLGLDSARNAATPNAGFYYGGLAMIYMLNGKTAGRLLMGNADIVDATHPAGIVSGLEYSPLGGVSSASFGSVYGEGNTYSPRGWLVSRNGIDANGSERSGSLMHDLSGNVTQLTDSVTGVTQYVPDQLNRLTSYSNPSYGGAMYTYDAWGNLYSYTNTNGQGYNYSLTMTPQNRFSQTGSTNSGFVYDASGDVLADGLNSYSYDAEGRLSAVNGATQYLYGPDGTRVATLQGGAVTAEYLYGMDGTLATTVDSTGKLVRGSLYGGGMHLADYIAGTGAGGGSTQFHLANMVNSLVDTVDQTGALVEDCSTYPFGENLTCTPSVDFTEKHFTDNKRDQESGLDYFGARMYSSIMGRFTSPDPLGGHLENPQSLNKYAYALNNPLTNTDPTGLDSYLHCTPTGGSTFCGLAVVGNDKHGQPQWAAVQGTYAANGAFNATLIGNDASGNLVDKTTGTGNYTASVNGSGVQFSNDGGQTSSTGVFDNGTPKTTFQDAGFANGGALSSFNFTLTNSKLEANQTEAGTFKTLGDLDQARQAIQAAGFQYFPVGGWSDIGSDEFRSPGAPGTGANSGHFILGRDSLPPSSGVPQVGGSMHFGEHNPLFSPVKHIFGEATQ